MNRNQERSIGTSLLAMMIALVGVLASMLAFSHLLRNWFTGLTSAGMELAPGLLVAAVTYLLLAYGLWKRKRWTRRLAFWSLMVLTIAGLLDMAGNEVMALSTVLVFLLGFISNLVVLLALHRAQTRELFMH